MILSPEIGKGIFTIPDASLILNIPSTKINSWLNKYWQSQFIEDTKNIESYTWGESKDRAFNFYTLIELIAVKTFREIGLPFTKIKLAHSILSNIYETPFPFATSKLLSDGKSIFLDEKKDGLLNLDYKLQYNFKEIISPYCKRLEFDSDTFLPTRFWPMGKEHSIVVDPHHSFGQPTINGTNINVYSLSNLLEAGESKEFIADVYKLNVKIINDVELFMKRNAA